LKYSRSGMPVISNEDIDTLGERMAVDFDHTSLFNTHPIDIERFVEKYLKMPIEFMYLSHCGSISWNDCISDNGLSTCLHTGR